uniref:Major facilitator superfamily associated domain-containing protein n=1 Tax=Megaselia scalaris TaxID=36166 RepID=T1GWV5_MEGSC
MYMLLLFFSLPIAVFTFDWGTSSLFWKMKRVFKRDELLRPPRDPSIEQELEGRVSFRSIIDMPYSIKVLCLTGLLSWMSHCSYSLYFTDFVGETVFKGSPLGSDEQVELYDAGVRYGCLGLSVFSITVSLYSIITCKLVKLCGLKMMYSGTLLFYAFAMFLLAFEPNKFAVLAYSVPAGAAYATMLTIPFTLVASYHEKGCVTTFKKNQGQIISPARPSVRL